MPEISVSVGPIFELIELVESRIRDFRPLFEGSLDTTVRGWMREQWDTEGAAGGNPWAQLSPVTIELKGRENRADAGILTHFGALQRSMTNRSDPFELRESTKTEYHKGTRVQSNGFPYALAHQSGWTMTTIFGHPVAEHRVPARPIVPTTLPNGWMTELSNVIAAYVERGES